MSLGRNHDTPRLTVTERHCARSRSDVRRTASRPTVHGPRPLPPGPFGTMESAERFAESDPNDIGKGPSAPDTERLPVIRCPQTPIATPNVAESMRRTVTCGPRADGSWLYSCWPS